MTGRSSEAARPTLSRQGELWRGRFSAMAGPCELLMDGIGEAAARRSVDRAAAEAWRIEARFSRYRSDSIASRINASAGHPVEVDEECARLLDFAAHCHRISEGAFDITSGVLRRAWTFDGGTQLPDPDEIRALLDLVGFERIDWRRPVIRLPRGMEIDLGGIGKEYAVDRVVDELAGTGAGHFLVNFGGDLRVTGPRTGGRPWTAAVEHPGAEGTGMRQIELLDGALATSGDARRHLVHRGRRYGHILDPRTGWPVADAPRSVTVHAPTCVEAGMLATLAILRGPGAAGFLHDHRVRSWVVAATDSG